MVLDGKEDQSKDGRTTSMTSLPDEWAAAGAIGSVMQPIAKVGGSGKTTLHWNRKLFNSARPDWGVEVDTLYMA